MLALSSPNEILRAAAARLRARRLARGWTQAELAARAGLKPATYILFERTGKISLERFVKLLGVLELLSEFERIGAEPDLSTLRLDQLVQPARQRGRRRSSAA